MSIERREERDVLGNQTGDQDESAVQDAGQKQGRLMSPDPRSGEFLDRLEDPEGCNLEFRVPGDIKSMTWTCDAEGDYPNSRRVWPISD
jgi:hypothetical protein